MDDNLNRNDNTGFDSVEPKDDNENSVTPSGEFFTKQEEVSSEANNTEKQNDENYNAEPVFNMPEMKYNPYIPQSGPAMSPKGSSEKRYGVGTVIVAAILAAVIGAVTSIGVLVAGQFLKADDNVDNTSSITSSSESQGGGSNINIVVDKTAESVIEAVAEKVTPSVVGIRTMAAVNNFFGSSEETTGEGSGVIYSTDGYIITNYHVIESAVGSQSSTIQVFLGNDDEKGISATVVGYNISNDLAVIKIQAPSGLKAIELGSSEDLKVGQFVAAIGNPGGLEFMGSVTYGIISGLNRTISDGDSAYLIQTDAAINPGNSGGALVNTEGKLVGINSSKIVSESYEGMGFAIPVDSVKEICDKIISKENDPTPYIGITISERYDSKTLQYLNFPVGAVVQSVVSGGPADLAKIRRGDIITEFNGTKITDYTMFSDILTECKPGENVAVVIYRSGRYYSTSIKIAANNAQ